MENSILKIFGPVDVKIAPDLIVQKFEVLQNYSAIFCVNFSRKKKKGYERIFVFTKSQPVFRCSLSWLYVSKAAWHMLQTWSRYRPRFFDQVGHQTMSAFIENKHFFTKSRHGQPYQNYEQPPQNLQNLCFPSHFSASKINQIFLNFFL